jgi:hypothetical protein
MSTTLEVNLSEYDSSKFLSVFQSLRHSLENILARNNRIQYYRDSSNILIPYDVVGQELIPLLQPYFATETLDPMYHMNPQYYCFMKYQCVDLWDLILTINQCMCAEEFTQPTVTYLTHDGIQELFIFLQGMQKAFKRSPL